MADRLITISNNGLFIKTDLVSNSKFESSDQSNFNHAALLQKLIFIPDEISHFRSINKIDIHRYESYLEIINRFIIKVFNWKFLQNVFLINLYILIYLST